MGAIIDNNRPGVWVWMTRAEFLDRWRDMQGGWAIVFLDPPPPSYPEGVQAADGCKCKAHKPGEPWPDPDNCGEFACKANGGKGGCTCGKTAAAPACICGDDCKCKPGECPKKCPVLFGQCQNGRCPIAQPAAPIANDYNGETPPGPAPDGYEWRKWDDAPGFGWRMKQPGAGVVDDHGVASDKIHAHPEYTICRGGHTFTASKADAHSFLAGGISDDSNRWHLSAVGDAAFLAAFKRDVDALPSDVRAKLLVQGYAPDRWEVSQFKLDPGVSLRKPSPGRVSANVGAVAIDYYSAAALNGLLAIEGGPNYVKPAPKPPEPVAPAKPDPMEPSKPDPNAKPAPDKTPTPEPAKPDLKGWLAALVLVLAWLANRYLPKRA
jgi:hypothetical protein